MKNQNFELPIYGLNGNYIASADAASFAMCFNSYSDNCPMEDISCIGYNSHSGYAYIALKNGVTIASCFNQECDYFIIDPDTEQELGFCTYQDAIDALHPMSNPLND